MMKIEKSQKNWLSHKRSSQCFYLLSAS